MSQVREAQAMIAGMSPVLQDGLYMFRTVTDADTALLAQALASFREEEGLSLILPVAEADRLGLAYETPMKQITLMVFSSLEGVGLTAAVAKALAREDIPANVVAATQHDHVFVPSDMADKAMQALRKLQEKARAS